jgi:AraC family transcriptional regulator
VSVEPTALTGRDRLRELLDAVVPDDTGAHPGVDDMARATFSSEFHFSRQVRRMTGESPAALRRRILLERAAWRLGRGEGVAAVAAAEGWSSPEVFSRAFRRSFGIPPSQVAESGRGFRLPAPNGLHFHPPQSLWIDGEPGGHQDAAVSRLMIDHDIADTAHLIGRAAALSKTQWTQELSPGLTVLEWDGPEPSVGHVLSAIVWTKEIWLASIEGLDHPSRDATDPAQVTPQQLAAHHDDVARRWTAMVTDFTARGRLTDTVIDALCDPPESFQVFGIVAHVLTYAAHRRELARRMLADLGVPVGVGDPLDWMRSH